jgi:MinD-like ATPase involved in chromosome partitioning or flagellar assembly
MNEQAVPNVIYIGPAAVGDAIAKMRSDWNFFPHVPDISTFRAGLSSGSIDNNIQVVMVVDKFFDPQARDTSFEKLVASLSPYCMFCVISYTADLRNSILDRVEHERFTNSYPDGKVYFVDYSRPNRTIDEAVDVFLSDPPPEADEAAAIISGGSYVPQVPQDANPEASEAVKVTAPPIPKGDCLGQVIAVTSSKGGSGKSTVSITLATYLAHSSINSVKEGLLDSNGQPVKKPLKVLLLDLDVRDGQVGFFTGFWKPTVMKLRRFGISREQIEETKIYDEGLKIDVMLAPRRPRSAEELPPEFYVELITHLRSMYDYIILDTSVNYLDPLLEKVAYPMADLIVMVTEVVSTSVFSMARWVQEVTSPLDQNGMNIPKRKIGIVVNKSLKSVNMTGKKIAENAQEVPIVSVIPSNQRLIAHATNVNSMEVLLEHEDLRPSFARLAESIVGSKYPLSKTVP